MALAMIPIYNKIISLIRVHTCRLDNACWITSNSHVKLPLYCPRNKFLYIYHPSSKSDYQSFQLLLGLLYFINETMFPHQPWVH